MTHIKPFISFLNTQSESDHTQYEDWIQKITPKSTPLQTLMPALLSVSNHNHMDLMLQVLISYMPSCQNNSNIDDVSFLHTIDATIRKKDQALINQLLKATLKQSQNNFDSPLMNTLLSLGILFSGVADDDGFDNAIACLYKTLGDLPFHELSTYDDDPEDESISDPQFPTAAVTRLVVFLMVYFNESQLDQCLLSLTTKKDNQFDFESLWLEHHPSLMQWLTLSNAKLYSLLSKKLNPQPPLQMNLFSLPVNEDYPP